MKIVVDDKIPYIKGQVEKIADEVVYLSGNSFTNELVKDADALIVRTRTACNRGLLEGSHVKFIATATIGYDHIDVEYCREAGIEWTNCPGCNAGSVEQYIHSALLLLKRKKGLQLRNATLGIVGVGHVGSRVQRMAEDLGMDSFPSILVPGRYPMLSDIPSIEKQSHGPTFPPSTQSVWWEKHCHERDLTKNHRIETGQTEMHYRLYFRSNTQMEQHSPLVQLSSSRNSSFHWNRKNRETSRRPYLLCRCETCETWLLPL